MIRQNPLQVPYKALRPIHNCNHVSSYKKNIETIKGNTIYNFTNNIQTKLKQTQSIMFQCLLIRRNKINKYPTNQIKLLNLDDAYHWMTKALVQYISIIIN